MPATTHSISATAAASDQFKTLTAALKAADLVSVLEGVGPFTVFAPTDAAFAKVPEATLAELLLPANKDKLAGILKFHVMAGAVMAKDVAGKTVEPTSVHGETLKVDGSNGVKVNGATVVVADIACSNGVIHGIDTVLMPKA